MPSIRRSLTGYFLLLMAVTFLAVGLIVDGSVSAANEAREQADETRLRQNYDDRCRETLEKFDNELWIHAQGLLRELRKEYWGYSARARQNVMLVALLPSALGGDPWATAAAAVAPAAGRRSAFDALYFRSLAKYQTDGFQRRPPDDGEHVGLYNIHLPRTADGRLPPIRPASQGFNFPLDPDLLDRDSGQPEDHHETGDVTVPGHGDFRRVVYRYPLIGRLSNLFGQRPPRDPKAPAAQPSLYIQYARPRADLDALLDAHRAQFDADLAEVRGESARYRRRFLTHLVLVGVAGFLSLFAGSLWIIRRGLRPLDTLSTAVSRVSERDFRLPVSPDRLSEDLLPIHRHLTLTLDALRRAFEREKQAVGDISHELRTPLAALRTTLDVALRKPREAEQYKATLTDCREIARQLSRLVDRILTLAALDSGSIAPSAVPTDITALATECVAVIRPLAESHDLTFRADLPPGIAASTDPDRLREVMMNLLHNAVEYNRPGGEVALRLSRTKSAVRVAVTDTGIGIPPELQAKIFERFYRADASRHATGVHAGLGLAIVKEYLTRLGGTIAVDSEPGRGTTFTVTLPA